MTPRCLSTYVELPEEGYSRSALTRLTDGRKLRHRLGFDRAEVGRVRLETMTRMSISGVQDKISLRLRRGSLEPTADGGEYILKPIPSTPLPRFQNEVPATESLSMQLAERVFGLRTAANALIRLSDGELAYLTRRFDRGAGGARIAQEDFCQLMELSPSVAGPQFKYSSSYEEVASTLQRFSGTYVIEAEKLFRQLLVNYLIGNGDAHLKNFSLQQTSHGDYVLSPVYDLLCTRLHIPGETRLGLDLFADDEVSSGEETHGFVTGGDFAELARRMSLRPDRAQQILDGVVRSASEVDAIVAQSFLSPEAQDVYRDQVEEGRRMLSVRD